MLFVILKVFSYILDECQVKGPQIEMPQCRNSTPGMIKHASHIMQHKQLMVMPLVSCFFFYEHSKESLSAIILYGQLATLMVLC